MSEANKALVRRVMEESWNKRNMTLMDELFDPGYVYHGVVEGEITGVEAMKQFLTSLYAAIPDAQHMIQEQVAEGDKVVTRFKSTGTPQMEFMGIAPSGKQITVDEVTISRIAGGRIVEDWNTWDVLGLFRQLGAGPQATGANKALLRRWLEEGANKGNLALFDELYGDCVYCSPATGKLKREALKEFVASLLAGFPDGRWTIEDQVAEGDKVVTRWSFTGTHQGELMGIAPTGKHVTTSGMVMDRIVEGKIVEEREEWDTLGMMQQMGAAPQATEANKALARRYVDDFLNKGNWVVADEIFAEGYVLRAPHFPELHGPEAMKQLHIGLRASFPDFHYAMEEPIAEGDKVVLRWTGTGTHKGEWMGVVPTGKSIRWSGIDILRIAGGKIVEEWGEVDVLGFFQQVGAVPPLGQAEDKAAA